MDLKTLILLLENKIRTKDFILPYNSKSLDASTIQTLNQNISQENLEKLISEILNQNVTDILIEDFNDHETPKINQPALTNDVSETSQTQRSTYSNNTTNKLNNLGAFDELTKFKELKKNVLLLNFLSFSNEQVIEYVKIFSFSNDLLTVTTSYNQLINFLGYYKISSFFLNGVDEFSIILSYFKKDLLEAYYTFLHLDYNSGLNQLVISNKITSEHDYLEVVENLDKSQKEFVNENEKILEKSNNQFNDLINQKRQRKIILSGLLMLGSYALLAKTGLPILTFSQIAKFLISPLSGGEMGPDSAFGDTDFSSNTRTDFNGLKSGLNSESSSGSIRFRDVYDLSLKILYKKLITIFNT